MDRGDPCCNRSVAYEYILAATVLKNLPGMLCHEVFGSILRDLFQADNRWLTIVNKTFMTSLMTCAADYIQTIFHGCNVSLSNY